MRSPLSFPSPHFSSLSSFFFPFAMSESPRSPASHADEHHAADPAPLSLYEDHFYDSRQAALLLSGMGLGFVVLMVILFVVGS